MPLVPGTVSFNAFSGLTELPLIPPNLHGRRALDLPALFPLLSQTCAGSLRTAPLGGLMTVGRGLALVRSHSLQVRPPGIDSTGRCFLAKAVVLDTETPAGEGGFIHSPPLAKGPPPSANPHGFLI